MELRVLQYFLAVAREQSISAAAGSLHISRNRRFSTQMKALEEELGKQLLIRGVKGSRRVMLTDEGMVLRKRAEEILSLVRKTEEEIACPDEAISGEVSIGSGETELVRLFARAARAPARAAPGHTLPHFQRQRRVCAGKPRQEGLIDFGLLFGGVDVRKYDTLPMPACGPLGRTHAPGRAAGAEGDHLPGGPLGQAADSSPTSGATTITFSCWMKREISRLNVVATYNLVYNASLLVDEGLGYALTFDGLIHTEGSDLCFRPLAPQLEAPGSIVWKKYQVFSKPRGGVFAVPARPCSERREKRNCQIGKMAVYYWVKEGLVMELKDNLIGLEHVGVPTKDLAKTIAFYESLGFTVALRTAVPGGGEMWPFCSWAM